MASFFRLRRLCFYLESCIKPDQVWQATLGELQLQLTKSTYDTWLRDTSLISHEDGAFVVGVENAYAKDWLENRLLSTIKRTLTGIVGRATEVRFVVWADPVDAAPIVEAVEPTPVPDRVDSASGGTGISQPKLNLKYKFEGFVVGPSNRLAHAAALAAAENPKRT